MLPGDRTRDGGRALVVGVVSGTSLDGIDVAPVEVARTAVGVLDWSLLHFRIRPYDRARRESISRAIGGGGAGDLCRLHAHLGEWFAWEVLAPCGDAGVDPGTIAAMWAHLESIPANIPQATGAREARVLGSLTPASGSSPDRALTHSDS
jgi:anhydro-N-acetylmuramic acid kinase